MSRKDKGRIAGPFVPMLTDTMKAPAWRAMSAHARVVYVALKSRYSIKAKNNGRIYLSARQAELETGIGKNIIARSFREMQYYGFIVQTDPGCLGVDGKGKAPHWRLTELGYMLDPPTRDFMHWSGEVFHEQKPPEYYKRQERRLAKLAAARLAKKTESRTDVRDTLYRRPVHTTVPTSGHLADELYRRPVHTDDAACTDVRDISRLTTPPLEKRGDGQGGAGAPADVACAGCKPAEIDWHLARREAV